MTFTILGRDPTDGKLGIAIATYSLAVGATCPQILPGTGVVTSQAATNPAIGQELIELLKNGTDPATALKQVVTNDSQPEFRQIALLTANGEALVHSGANTKPFSGHVTGENCVAVGNFLADKGVLEQMAQAFDDTTATEPLAKKLIAALEAGKTAGGQREPHSGTHLAERSACLVVAAPEEPFPVDIRVDFSEDAIPALSHALAAYNPMHRYYLQRAENPASLPNQYDFVKRLDPT
jgi:uncharacterized Ntn-hydrolase superfamily protein